MTKRRDATCPSPEGVSRVPSRPPSAVREAAHGASWAQALAFRRRRLIGPFAWGLLALNLAVGACWLGAIVPAHWDISFPEGLVADRALAVARGGSAYVDWRAWPHAFAQYGPLAYYPVGWLGRLTSAHPSGRFVLLLGRGESALALLAIGWLVYWLARRGGMSRAWAWMAPAACMTWPALLYYGLSYRPDAPATALAIGALAIVATGRATSRRAAAALGLLMLSMWMKPTAWGMVAAIAWWMAEGMGRRKAAWGIAAWGAAGLGAAWALNAHWRGLLFLNMASLNAMGGVRRGFSLGNMLGNAAGVGWAAGSVMAVGALASTATLRRRAVGDSREHPHDHAARQVARAALATLVVCLLQSFKIGSDVNYFMTPFPLLALAATREVGSIWRGDAGSLWHARRGPWPIVREVLLWCVLLPALVVPMARHLSGTRDDFLTASNLARPLPLTRELEWARGRLILTTHPFLPLELAGAPTVMDYYCYSALARRGLIDRRPLQALIERQAFAVIVVDQDPWERKGVDPSGQLDVFFPGCFDLIAKHYRETDRMGIFVVLEPRSSARAPGQGAHL